MFRKRKIKQVLLVWPPVTRPAHSMRIMRMPAIPPMGAASLAAVLEKEFPVSILDCLIEGYDEKTETDDGWLRHGLSDDAIKQKIRDVAPTVLGTTCLFSNQIRDVLNLCRLTKEVDPDILTVIGGGHPSADPDFFLKDPNLDLVCIGEGEIRFPAFLRALEGRGSFADLDGFAYRAGGRVKVIPGVQVIQDVEALPFPARHLLPMKKYLWSPGNLSETHRHPATPLITSRGCTAGCIFCGTPGMWGRTLRGNSPEKTLREIEFLVDKYGIKELQFYDDQLLADRKRATGIFQGIIGRGYDLTWTTPNGVSVWCLDRDMLDLMKKSGCVGLSLAIESGDDHVLRQIIDKPLKTAKVRSVVKVMKELGMRAKGYFILGLPGESKAQMQRTVDLARQLELDWCCFNIASPLPGSRMYEICLERGYLDPEFDFTFVNFGQANISTEDFTAADVEAVASAANLDVNFYHNSNLRNGHLKEAIFDFDRVVRCYPDHVVARYCLGAAYQKAGSHEKAVSCWEKALEMNPDYEPAANALRGDLETPRNNPISLETVSEI